MSTQICSTAWGNCMLNAIYQVNVRWQKTEKLSNSTKVEKAKWTIVHSLILSVIYCQVKGLIGSGCPDLHKLSVDVLPPQGVVGDAGERGPPGPDGNEVRTVVRLLVNSAVPFFLSYTFDLPLDVISPFCLLYKAWVSLFVTCPLSSVTMCTSAQYWAISCINLFRFIC